MKLIGGWGNPLNISQYDSLIRSAVKSMDARCCYCGFESIASPINPSAGLSVCVRLKTLPVESANLITLCAFCHPLNDISNLVGKGHFVELPWYSQSQLTNIQRTLYCVQASRSLAIKKLPIYKASNSILRELDRTPPEWDSFTFAGSPERIKQAIENHKGYTEADKDKSVYIDRLRFIFSPDKFMSDINDWLPIVEEQVLKAYAE